MERRFNPCGSLVSLGIGVCVVVLTACGEGSPRSQGDLIELSWADLIPDNRAESKQVTSPEGIVEHGQAPAPVDPSVAGLLTTEYNHQTVSLPGYVVPLKSDHSDYAQEFLLVPYVGACVHVPPPPPNQIVLVRSHDPYEFRGLFEPVTVTGELLTVNVETELAEAIGYTITAEQVTPYTE